MNQDFPEAETMETRKVLKTRYRLEGAFWMAVVLLLGFLFAGNWFICLLQ